MYVKCRCAVVNYLHSVRHKSLITTPKITMNITCECTDILVRLMRTFDPKNYVMKNGRYPNEGIKERIKFDSFCKLFCPGDDAYICGTSRCIFTGSLYMNLMYDCFQNDNGNPLLNFLEEVHERSKVNIPLYVILADMNRISCVSSSPPGNTISGKVTVCSHVRSIDLRKYVGEVDMDELIYCSSSIARHHVTASPCDGMEHSIFCDLRIMSPNVIPEKYFRSKDLIVAMIDDVENITSEFYLLSKSIRYLSMIYSFNNSDFSVENVKEDIKLPLHLEDYISNMICDIIESSRFSGSRLRDDALSPATQDFSQRCLISCYELMPAKEDSRIRKLGDLRTSKDFARGFDDAWDESATDERQRDNSGYFILKGGEQTIHPQELRLPPIQNIHPSDRINSEDEMSSNIGNRSGIHLCHKGNLGFPEIYIVGPGVPITHSTIKNGLSDNEKLLKKTAIDCTIHSSSFHNDEENGNSNPFLSCLPVRMSGSPFYESE